MNCIRCNNPLAKDARFCGICGYSFSNQDENVPGTGTGSNDATVMMSLPPSPSLGNYRGEQADIYQRPGLTLPQQPEQAGVYQQPQSANPQSLAYPPGMMLGTMSSTGNVKQKPKRRAGGCLLRVLLVLVLLLAVLAGAWFAIVRPYIHNIAQAQLDQALNEAEGQIVLVQLALPQGKQIITVSESDLNSYLNGHDTDNLQNLHMTIMPGGLQLSFTAYGFQCMVLATPIVSAGALQVTNVQVQGVLWLVMSNAELTTDLNSHFQDIGQQMHRSINAITLDQHKLDITIS